MNTRVTPDRVPAAEGFVSAGPGSKVPAVTVLFWAIKLLTTGLGESTSDFLVRTMDPLLAVTMGAVGFIVVLVLQLRTRRHVPGVYWAAVVMVSVFGTMAADVVHTGLGVPYLLSSGFFLLVLAAVFRLWSSTEGTLSFHSIRTRRRELFYWAAVVVTFALGTAVGDLAAITFSLGYLAAGLVFTVMLFLPLLAKRYLGAGSVATFWSCYVLTRPVGASFADWLGVGPSRGGLDLGAGWVSLGLLVLIAGCVAFQSKTGQGATALPGGAGDSRHSPASC